MSARKQDGMTVWSFMQLVQQLAGESAVQEKLRAGESGIVAPSEAGPILEGKIVKVMRRRRWMRDLVIDVPVKMVGLDAEGNIVVVIDK